MPACKNSGCDNELTPERCLALLEMGQHPSEFVCPECSEVKKSFGLMVPSADSNSNSGKTYGKTGQVLVTIDPSNKEHMRLAKRFIKRAR